MAEDKSTKVSDLAQRRGFYWPSWEIYGGVAGLYDLGPLGKELQNKIIELWKKVLIRPLQRIVFEMETPILTPYKVLEASGHVENFTDPIVECKNCGRKFRADHLIEEATGIKVEGLKPEDLTKIIRENNIRCPVCGGELGEVRPFLLLFQTQIGPYEGSKGFLRPETAQGAFVNFKKVYQLNRERLPFGIAQIGRVGRNEISPRQGLLRLREFTIAEIEFFIDPLNPGKPPLDYEAKIRLLPWELQKEGVKEPVEVSVKEALERGWIINEWMAYWMLKAKELLNRLGISDEDQFFEEKSPEERAHYSSQTYDQLVRTERYGWMEVSGHAYRGDYDVSRHIEYSGKDLYAIRRLSEPKRVKRKVIRVNKRELGIRFKSEAKEIMKRLNEMNPDEVEKELRERGYVKVNDHELGRDLIWVEEVEEVITVERFVPHVVEPSFGVERLLYVALEHAYKEKDGRVILSLPREIAPIQVVVLPLLEEEKLKEKALEIVEMLSENYRVEYDEKGSIGRRYARWDEVGVPLAITVDFQTLEDNTVTFRDRDTWKQVRVKVSEVPAKVEMFLKGKPLEELGTPIEGSSEE
ncbi:glycyl-tRNA synthetease [Ignicoccus islandicus DSM 13165]|uniref:glycine--tRNA ligase n=1 Tax=Ignicoccus islandicus DSM 13165 TaxID=940295 RepID=A0A0U3FI84_9CREN|nr:glycine--tRNA ligase [Ignicoccus islandicus]ALU11606.1 glycyl-tRNA synthetease [Ignicoccus islandicus DSM 13165]